MISCPYCHATVGLGQQVVAAKDYRDAWERARAEAVLHSHRVDCGRQSFRVLAHVGNGHNSTVYVAERVLPSPIRVCLKVGLSDGGDENVARLRQEAEVLRSLQRSEAPGAHALTRRLPLVLGFGVSEGPLAAGRPVLILRHPAGAWGSLAAALTHYPGGVPATHMVWMWRRVLESLIVVHASGYGHGDLSLDHMLVHPHDHLVHLIGWGAAAKLSFAKGKAALRAPTRTRDLAQTAWAMRWLIGGKSSGEPSCDKAPAPLARLLQAVSEDPDFTDRLDARTLNDQVSAAAREAFGPPRFLHFNLPQSR